MHSIPITTCGSRRRSCWTAIGATKTGGKPWVATTHPTVRSGRPGTGHGFARIGNASPNADKEARVTIHQIKGKHALSTAVLFSILAAPSLVAGALTVIYDSGDTYPLAPFLAVFDEEPDQGNRPQASPTPPRPPPLGAADLERLLPIQSPGLTPGRVEPRAVQTAFRPTVLSHRRRQLFQRMARYPPRSTRRDRRGRDAGRGRDARRSARHRGDSPKGCRFCRPRPTTLPRPWACRITRC